MYVLCAQILDAHVLDVHELKKMLAEKEKRAIYVYICYVCCCYTIAVTGSYWDMYGHLHVN